MVLTANEEKILNFIQRYFDKKGYAPSNIEIHKHFGFKSKNSVRQYLKALAEKKMIQWSEGSYKKRTIQLRKVNGQTPHQPNDLLQINIEGEVAAGYMTEAIESKEAIRLPQEIFKPGFEHFALRVKGDSMIGDHIMDGDVIVIRKTSQFSNGQIVVVDLGGEATLKRIYWDGKQVELRASNPEFSSQFVKDKAEFKVLGRLCYVSRNVD